MPIDTASLMIIYLWGGISALAAGLIFLHRYLRAFPEAIASLSWPSVTGTITNSSIETRLNDDRAKHHLPIIVFIYQVEGAEYRSSRIKTWRILDGKQSGSTPSSKTNAEYHVKKYPKGKQVDVYYSLNNPEKAVLEPGPWLTPFSLEFVEFFVAGLSTLIGFLLLIMAFASLIV